MSSASSAAAATAPVRCSHSATPARKPSRGPIAQRSAYAFSPAMQKLSSDAVTRRDTFLSFQPPAIGDEEIEAVTETLRSGWLTTGPRTAELERRFAEYVGAKHALAVTSGTAALHMALVAPGVAPGEGGVITTNDDDVARAVDDHRIMRRGHGSLYDIAVPGYKANLSDVLASIALCQLDKLERHREIRLRHVAAYDAAVAELDGIEPLARDPRDLHALHLYVVRVDADRAGATRDEYQRALAEEQIGTSIHFLPVHLLTAYRERFPEQPPLPVAERAGAEVLSLPLSPAHSDADVADAIDALRRVHGRFVA